MGEKEKKQQKEEENKAVTAFFRNMILALSYLPQDKYETLLKEVNKRRLLADAMIKAMIPFPKEWNNFRSYAILKIIKWEFDNER